MDYVTYTDVDRSLRILVNPKTWPQVMDDAKANGWPVEVTPDRIILDGVEVVIDDRVPVGLCEKTDKAAPWEPQGYIAHRDRYGGTDRVVNVEGPYRLKRFEPPMWMLCPGTFGTVMHEADFPTDGGPVFCKKCGNEVRKPD